MHHTDEEKQELSDIKKKYENKVQAKTRKGTSREKIFCGRKQQVMHSPSNAIAVSDNRAHYTGLMGTNMIYEISAVICQYL